MTAVPGTRAFVSTAIHGNPLFRGSAVSYDAGQTWTEIENVANKAVCRFFDAETGYAGGFFVTGPPLRGGIFKSQIVFQRPAPEESNIAAKKRTSENVETERENQVKVYPTPANDVINVALQDDMVNAKSVISIVSMDGKVMQTTTSAKARSVQLNVSNLPAGSYILRIASDKQTIKRVITISR